MWSELRRIGRELTGDVRVVLVRGEGRSFSAGLDLTIAQAGDGTEGSFADLVSLGSDAAADRIAAYQEAFSWLTRPDIVSIAAVQGHAIGAGFQLALACDLRVLTSDAQFTMGEIRIGLVPDLGGTRPLVELVGYSRAFEICATGRRVGADEARAIGLANLVVPPADLDDAVRDLAAALLSGARDAVIETKALLRGALARTPGEQRLAERQAQVRRIRDLAGLGE
jgi:enoyl-CoA hydratase/carnithine racemase